MVMRDGIDFVEDCMLCGAELAWDMGMWKSADDAGICPAVRHTGFPANGHEVRSVDLRDGPEAIETWLRG